MNIQQITSMIQLSQPWKFPSENFHDCDNQIALNINNQNIFITAIRKILINLSGLYKRINRGGNIYM